MRYPFVDQLRGFAVILMIIFHTAYDLSSYSMVSIDFKKDLFWWILPRLIVTLFLFSVGISLRISHFPIIKWAPFWKRLAKVGGGALLISIFTYYLFPQTWIYFGTLHCIFTASIAAIGLIKFPKTSAALALAILVPFFIFNSTLPWPKMTHSSMDYIPLFPWISVVLLGIWSHKLNLHKTELWTDAKLMKVIQQMGKHSFAIYLIHQPVLFGIISLIHKFTQ